MAVIEFVYAGSINQVILTLPAKAEGRETVAFLPTRCVEGLVTGAMNGGASADVRLQRTLYITVPLRWRTLPEIRSRGSLAAMPIGWGGQNVPIWTKGLFGKTDAGGQMTWSIEDGIDMTGQLYVGSDVTVDFAESNLTEGDFARFFRLEYELVPVDEFEFERILNRMRTPG